MSFYASYKRYWEPSTPGALTIGAFSGAIAHSVAYPFEYLRTKSQIRLEGIGMRQKSIEMGVNPYKVFSDFVKNGYGVGHVFTGFQASMASRLSYLMVRNLVYKVIYDMKKPAKPTNDLGHDEKAGIAALAGTLGTIVSNPFDIMRIRETSDLGRPEQFRRNYKGIGDGLAKIAAEKPGYFRGLLPNICRAIVLNTVMIYPYDMVREHMYNAFGDVFVNPIAALTVAAAWGTTISLPIDNIRTRMMNQFEDRSLNRMNYKGIVDCVTKSLEVEGLNCFFVGYYAHYLQVFVYAGMTLWISDVICSSRKRAAGLEEHQI